MTPEAVATLLSLFALLTSAVVLRATNAGVWRSRERYIMNRVTTEVPKGFRLDQATLDAVTSRGLRLASGLIDWPRVVVLTRPGGAWFYLGFLSYAAAILSLAPGILVEAQKPDGLFGHGFEFSWQLDVLPAVAAAVGTGVFMYSWVIATRDLSPCRLAAACIALIRLHTPSGRTRTAHEYLVVCARVQQEILASAARYPGVAEIAVRARRAAAVVERLGVDYASTGPTDDLADRAVGVAVQLIDAAVYDRPGYQLTPGQPRVRQTVVGPARPSWVSARVLAGMAVVVALAGTTFVATRSLEAASLVVGIGLPALQLGSEGNGTTAKRAVR